MGLVLCRGDLPQLVQESLLTFGQEEDLAMTEIPQFAGGLAPTDAALVAAELPKQCLQLQIVWG
jgi:hypothetical protein